MRHDPYRAHARLTDPATENASLWRVALGLCIVAVVSFSLGRALFAIARWTSSPESYWSFVAQVETADTPLGMLVLLFAMGALGIGALVATELAHRRSGLTLFGPLRLCLWQGLRVLAALAVLYATIAVLPPWTLVADLQPGVPAALWISLLPVILLALLVQTGAEELVFRGYLQAQLGARFRHPVLWIGIPSALFGLGHYAPELYGANAWLIVLWAFAFGLAAADLTARAGTLGPAIALHLVNNFVAIGLVGLQGEMSGLALRQLPYGPENEAALRALLPIDLAVLALGWLTARLALRA